jgi:hypothetical protein
MKVQFIKLALLSSILFTVVSCKKEEMAEIFTGPTVSRKVQFSLYTSQNFGAYNDSISFLLRIRNAKGQTLWDSTLPKMRIKDIPNFENRIFVEKAVPDADSSLLKVGFVYTVDNVGISWYQDTMRKSTAIKVMSYNFR